MRKEIYLNYFKGAASFCGQYDFMSSQTPFLQTVPFVPYYSRSNHLSDIIRSRSSVLTTAMLLPISLPALSVSLDD